MEGAPKYQPSAEEIKKAEESMTEEKKMKSEIREESLIEGGKRGAWKYLAAKEGEDLPEFGQEEEKILDKFVEQKIRKGDRIDFIYYISIERGEKEEGADFFEGITKDGIVKLGNRPDLSLREIVEIKRLKGHVTW